MNILLVEDNVGFRDALAMSLESNGNYFVVSCLDGESAISMVHQGKTDFQLAIVDLELPGINGVETIRALRQCVPDLPVLVLTVFENPTMVLDAIYAGAKGYLLKGVPLQEIHQAILNLTNGLSPLSDRVIHHIISHLQQIPVISDIKSDALSKRESEVLKLLGKGAHYKSVAQTLGITVGTVQTYVKRIYRKLGVKSKSEAWWVNEHGNED